MATEGECVYEITAKPYSYAGSFRHALRATTFSEGGSDATNISGNINGNGEIEIVDGIPAVRADGKFREFLLLSWADSAVLHGYA